MSTIYCVFYLFNFRYIYYLTDNIVQLHTLCFVFSTESQYQYLVLSSFNSMIDFFLCVKMLQQNGGHLFKTTPMWGGQQATPPLHYLHGNFNLKNGGKSFQSLEKQKTQKSLCKKLIIHHIYSYILNYNRCRIVNQRKRVFYIVNLIILLKVLKLLWWLQEASPKDINI